MATTAQKLELRLRLGTEKIVFQTVLNHRTITGLLTFSRMNANTCSLGIPKGDRVTTMLKPRHGDGDLGDVSAGEVGLIGGTFLGSCRA